MESSANLIPWYLDKISIMKCDITDPKEGSFRTQPFKTHVCSGIYTSHMQRRTNYLYDKEQYLSCKKQTG